MAVFQAHDAVHALGQIRVVGGDERRQPGAAAQFQHDLENIPRRRRIEVTGRPVGQQKAGSGC